MPFHSAAMGRNQKLFGKTNKDPHNIKDTIKQWGQGQLSIPMVRRAWSLAVGLNMWMIWKERNMKIFQNKEISPKMIWKRTQSHIREAILAETWNQEDWKTTPKEEKILAYLHLEQGMVHP